MDKVNIQDKDIARLIRENNRLSRALKEETEFRKDVENALVEIAEMVDTMLAEGKE